MRILVVDDEPALTQAVSYALSAEGFDVEEAADGAEALAAARRRRFDVILLDLVLPDLSGIEVCRRLRAESDVPILMLTARDAEVDRVIGLEAGADDYVTKPFSMAELVSRVRAILRRRALDRGSGAFAHRRVGDVEIDFAGHRVTVGGEPVALTTSEFRLLALLARDPSKVFSRREIMQHLWDSEYVGDERAADIHVSNLRRKLERGAGGPARVLTVRGAGYRLLEM